MNNKTNKLIPKLRFPEFVNEGEWNEKKLGDFGRFFRGLTYGADDTSGKGLLVLRSGNIQNETLVLDKDLVFVNKECPNELKLLKGDIVICMSNGSKALVGKNAEYRGEYDGKITVGAFCSIMRPKNKFTKYFLQSDAYQNFIALSIGGGNINNLKNSDLEEFECYAPVSPLEQQKIADCLSSLDELLTAHTDKLEALKTHKKGLMQNLFPKEGEKVPKIRFKEFEKDGEWKKKSFDKLFEIGNGRDYKQLNKGEIPVYGTGGYMLSVDDYLYDGESACIGRKGTIDKPMFLEGKFWTVDTLFYTHSFQNCIPKFIFYTFQNIDWKKHNEAGGVPSLSKANIYKIEVFSPKPKEQQKIVDTLSSLDEIIKEQENKIEQLKLHKKGLMQGLFPKVKK